MAEKAPPNSSNSNLNIHPPPPSSNSGSTSNAPFTPRSTTFPDGLDSDSEFDVFEPTPVHSPGGPRYDDLPPSYDEAQQQALQDARNGVPPLDPNNLEVHRLALNEHQGSPQPQVQPQRSTPEMWAHEVAMAPDNGRNANGLGMTVPVQQVPNSEQIPIGQVPSGNLPTANVPFGEANTTAPDPTFALLNRALEFTRHEPDADARFAPRLTRCVAIPQEGVPRLGNEHHRGPGRHHGCGRGGRGRFPSRAERREMHRMPGQWPESGSTDTVNTAATDGEEPVQFLRAYAKALHAHSIRPAEFTEFLDGLNALCIATNTTPNDLLHEDSDVDGPSAIVRNYIDATNEAFFAPRGLKVSLKSLSTLVEALKIPSERGQRAGATASALDERSSSEQRANALHPWIEKLETGVPSPSSQTLLLREMGERFRRQSFSSLPGNENEDTKPKDEEKARAGNEDSDPPHSIPEPPPGPGNQGFPPFGPGRGWGPTPWMPWMGPPGPWGRHGHHGRGWGPGHGHHHWGPPPPPHHGHHPHHGGPFGGGPGWRGGFGGRPGWRGAFGGRPGWHGPGHHGFGPRHAGPGNTHPNNWAAWGESIGKWGEEFGKRMEEWGQQFGRQAEEWGNDVGRRAGAWGEDIAARANGSGAPQRGESSTQAAASASASASAPAPTPVSASAATSGPEGLTGQETGVHHEDSNTSLPNPEASKDKENEKAAHEDDDDSSSVSSDSSSDSDSDEEYPDTHELFLQRIREINVAAETSRAKGKKSPEEIARERDMAIEKAQSQRTALEHKIEQKRQKRIVKKELRRKKREIKREHRRLKRELRGLDGGKRDKNGRKEKRKQREEYRERKKELRAVKMDARREWREAKFERRRLKREGGYEGWKTKEEGMVWIVVENLDA